MTCGIQFSEECFDNGQWHFSVEALDGIYKADLWYRAYGYPFWYGREKPSYLTQHSITYGYIWSSYVDDKFTYLGKTVKVNGTRQRAHYVAVDSSVVEFGGTVPPWYNIKIEDEDGVYEVRAHVWKARTWGVMFQALITLWGYIKKKRQKIETL